VTHTKELQEQYTIPPTPKQIDELVAYYERAFIIASSADEELEECKQELVALVQRFGSVPAGAEQSLRLQGAVTILTVTTGSSIAVKDAEVGELKGAMGANDQEELFARMFGTRTKYELLKGAENHLRIAQLPQRLVKKFTALYARCFDVKKKSPSLKIERLTDKPAKKPRAKKGEAA
jgi:hypothetical protein